MNVINHFCGRRVNIWGHFLTEELLISLLTTWLHVCGIEGVCDE